MVYSQPSSDAEYSTAIAVGVMSALAVLYAILLTWSWYRRSGRYTVDLLVMFKFVLFALGTVADAIFIVVLSSSLYYQFIYKVNKP